MYLQTNPVFSRVTYVHTCVHTCVMNAVHSKSKTDRCLGTILGIGGTCGLLNILKQQQQKSKTQVLGRHVPPPPPPPPPSSIATAMIRCYGQLIISHYFQSIVKLSQCPAVEIKINVNLFLLHEVTRIATRGVCNCLPVVRLTRSQIYSFRPSVSRSAEFSFGQRQH